MTLLDTYTELASIIPCFNFILPFAEISFSTNMFVTLISTSLLCNVRFPLTSKSPFRNVLFLTFKLFEISHLFQTKNLHKHLMFLIM